MTTLAQDGWSRADSGGWNTADDGVTIWAGVRGATTYSTESNKGAVAGNSGSYCIARAGSGTTADIDEVVTVTRVDALDVAGLVCRYQDNNNYYACTIGQFANNLTFDKMVAGVYTNVAFGPNTTFALATAWTFRFQVIGSAVKVKVWDASGSEPVGWDIDTTDTSLSSAGGYGIYCNPWTNGATKLAFDDYLATDGGSSTEVVTDLATRFRLRSANLLMDLAARFRLRSANQLADLAARFRLRSPDQQRDLASRFRLRSADALLDLASRFRLRSADQGRDLSARFRLRSTLLLPDLAARFRLRSAETLRDLACRFVLGVGTATRKDLACRFILRSSAEPNIAFTVPSGHITFIVPSGHITFETRS